MCREMSRPPFGRVAGLFSCREVSRLACLTGGPVRVAKCRTGRSRETRRKVSRRRPVTRADAVSHSVAGSNRQTSAEPRMDTRARQRTPDTVAAFAMTLLTLPVWRMPGRWNPLPGAQAFSIVRITKILRLQIAFGEPLRRALKRVSDLGRGVCRESVQNGVIGFAASAASCRHAKLDDHKTASLTGRGPDELTF